MPYFSLWKENLSSKEAWRGLQAMWSIQISASVIPWMKSKTFVDFVVISAHIGASMTLWHLKKIFYLRVWTIFKCHNACLAPDFVITKTMSQDVTADQSDAKPFMLCFSSIQRSSFVSPLSMMLSALKAHYEKRLKDTAHEFFCERAAARIFWIKYAFCCISEERALFSGCERCFKRKKAS